jgi:hypothetical protein
MYFEEVKALIDMFFQRQKKNRGISNIGKPITRGYIHTIFEVGLESTTFKLKLDKQRRFLCLTLRYPSFTWDGEEYVIGMRGGGVWFSETGIAEIVVIA